MEFAKPIFLWLFLLYIPLIVWYILKNKKSDAAIRISSVSAFSKLPTSYKVYLKHFLFVVRLAALGCVIIILCRPQTHDSWESSKTEGTDIVISLDVSTSMLARDFNPDRFEAAKEVASKFINGRESDNIGIVIFAGESFTLVPMTTDKAVLVNYIKEIKMGMLEDGTAIGDGLATAINRIKDGKAKSKSIILLTDGSNNTGVVAPLTAADIAAKYGIKVYTIGVGTTGSALFPVGVNVYGKVEYQQLPVVIDEATLKSIANKTGGKYFRATSKHVLKEIFSEIDKLEKTELDVRKYNQTEDNYMPWALLLLALLLIDIIARHTVLRNIP
ncbi:MAG: VWA domain-containing protein [Bacteroidales bacterium]|nr:VWA domain-containing protein [Muribaculaceae bacterium]MCI6856893.1 VWA domain-containing protein [Bacteroidales bacterium]MDY5893892.1 VWA domain-containing protein [Candidatus Limisoma sp.]MDD7604283.1 VWA domain-containing protein [Bacteroidales bacterium]MDD7760605.1 VWA domain-containing protein [Bacteroidales bacterium]